MAENLFPANLDNMTVTLDESRRDKKTGYKPGIFYDDEKGDCVRDGQYRIKSATGVEAWKQWCTNCLQTERYSSPYYSTDFGIRAEAAMKAGTRELAESILRTDIQEALLADPYGRTKYVESIAFNWSAPDTVEVTVTAVGYDGATIDLEKIIQR